MEEWFENEQFWLNVEAFLFTEERMQVASEEIDQVLRLANPPGKRALDLCCGVGRHSIALAEHGFEVTGVDLTPAFLQRASGRAAEANREIELIQSDMREFSRPGEFDLILNLFTSFGYCATEQDDQRVLDRIVENLRPGGAAVFQMKGKENLAKVFQPSGVTEGPDGTFLFEQRAVVNDWCRVRNRWTVVRGGMAYSHTFEHNIYSGAELRAMLTKAGSAEVRLFGGLDGTEYGPEADQLVAVAVKGA